ncbi:hypothetical protein [Deinococcus marmoris]|uniref:Uncharacterized protein n=1 Tax=Deinococcus marmoris TaxID=249408 RepID=A0A1U7P4N2_9DEIO|nr:hypothetical protein [Deinococcus marmoris]OLV20119.1 hypothetical protein BOO71_0000385 [Deinococcus marmoris]
MPDQEVILNAISKSPLFGGAAVLIWAIGYLLSQWRGGKASVAEKESLSERLELVEGRLAKAEKKLERVMSRFYTVLGQRNDAQNYARLLEQIYSHQPPRQWPVDPPLEDE